jgi:hypothetical protein
MQWWDRFKAATSNVMAVPFNRGIRSSLVPLTIEDSIKALLARELDAPSPDFSSIVSAWSTTNVMFTSGVLCAARALERDIDYWEKIAAGRKPGIWIRGKEALAIYDSIPSYSALRSLKEFVSVLHMHVGVLKMMTKHSLIFVDNELPWTSSDDCDSVVRDIVACCRMNTAFLHIIARADLQTSISVPSVTADLRAILDATVGSLDSRLVRETNAVSPHHMTMVFDSTGASWKSSKGQLSAPSIRECVVALQTELTCMHSEATLGNVLTQIAGRQHCTMPGHFERHLFAYVGLSCMSILAFRAIQAKSSTLGGSGDLELYMFTAKSSLATFFEQQLVEPLRGIYIQVLANGSTGGDAAERNENTLLESQQSLRRMLDQYKRDHPELAGSGMAAVLSAYEQQLRKPIRSAISGGLLETLLVITAKLKSDVEEILVRTAKQMSAQRINLHILAAVPAVLGVVGVLYAISTIVDRSRRRGMELLSSGGDTARYLIGDCRDILGLLKQEYGNESSDWQSRVELVGRLVGILRNIEHLLAQRSVTLSEDGVYRLRKDIRKLESQSLNLETRVAITDRMFQVYPLLMQKGRITFR